MASLRFQNTRNRVCCPAKRKDLTQRREGKKKLAKKGVQFVDADSKRWGMEMTNAAFSMNDFLASFFYLLLRLCVESFIFLLYGSDD